jgi:acetylornithine deacetylase
MSATSPLSLEAVTELTAALVRIPSVNPSVAPDEGGDERAVAAFACEWLSNRGVRAWTEDAAPGRPNVVAEVGDAAGPTLVLCAHLDTVGTAGMAIPPFEPRMEGDRLYGRGAYDMKGGAAAAMLTAAALADSDLRGRLMLALVADEEYASLGTSAFVAGHTADACIVTEPSALELVLAHKGFVWAEVTTRGRAAHGSRWDLGRSAIASMGRVLVALDDLDRDVLRARSHPAVGPASMHPALVEGGAGLSTYAPECRLKVERRTLPGETLDAIMEELRACVARADPEATVELFLARPPLACDPQSPIARSVRAAATRERGQAPKETGVAFWMDAALFEAAGIPTVNFGADGGGAHEAVEWASLGSILSCARVLERAARIFMSEHGRG